MIPDIPIVLKGKNLEEFEEYQNRTPTKEDIEYCEEADDLYRSNLPEDN